MQEILHDYLYHINTLEEKQRKTNSFHFDFPQYSVKYDDSAMTFHDDFFFNNRDIFINKHNRFADYPNHKHTFLEMNYMVNGTCEQVINGKTIRLEKGNILFLDQGSSHEIRRLDESDIMVNIIFRNKGMNLDWLTDLNQQNSLIFDFLTRDIKLNTKQSYLLFHSSTNNHIQEILNRILSLYFLESKNVNSMIPLYIPILITELITNASYETDKDTDGSSDSLMIDVLKIIESDFVNLDLTALANRVGYNKNYLSNRIKKMTGKSFIQLLNQEKLKHACFYLKNSNLTIEQIITLVGFTNKTHFYKLFESEYSCTPKRFREK